MDHVKRFWYLSPMRAAMVQASLRIRAVSPEPLLLAHTSSESRGTFRQKARSLAPLNGWACAVKICNDGMLEDTNSLDRAHMISCISYSMDQTDVNIRSNQICKLKNECTFHLQKYRTSREKLLLHIWISKKKKTLEYWPTLYKLQNILDAMRTWCFCYFRKTGSNHSIISRWSKKFQNVTLQILYYLVRLTTKNFFPIWCKVNFDKQ